MRVHGQMRARAIELCAPPPRELEAHIEAAAHAWLIKITARVRVAIPRCVRSRIERQFYFAIFLVTLRRHFAPFLKKRFLKKRFGLVERLIKNHASTSAQTCANAVRAWRRFRATCNVKRRWNVRGAARGWARGAFFPVVPEVG